MHLVTIIDTGISNITSVINAFERIGCEVKVTNLKDDIVFAKFLVLPGVGSFEHGMRALQKYDLIDIIREQVLVNKVPIIGICLGMQLLADSSTEHGTHLGLGIVSGTVVKLKSINPGYRTPNMGWCDVTPDKESVMFSVKSEINTYYHVHSYHLECTSSSDIAGYIEFDGKKITVAIEKNNIFGMQFHPEKSQDEGLHLLTKIVTKFQ